MPSENITRFKTSILPILQSSKKHTIRYISFPEISLEVLYDYNGNVHGDNFEELYDWFEKY